MNTCSNHLLARSVLALLLSGVPVSCGSFSVGVGTNDGYGYYPPQAYLYGQPYYYRPYNGDWQGNYVYWDGMWYYHGINTPYDWQWPYYTY